MIQKLSDKEYSALAERVKKGKEMLFGLDAVNTGEYRAWRELWFELSEMLFEQAKLRGVFKVKRVEEVSPNRIAGETPDEYVERMKIKLIQEKKLTGAWTKPFLREHLKKKGGIQINVNQSRSESHNLFEPS